MFSQPLGPSRALTRPVRSPERQLPPPADIPAYPVKRVYTKAEQKTIVLGTQQAVKGANRDEVLTHPVTRARLEPYFRVKAQQQAEANRRYAQNFGVTPQQAAKARQDISLRSQIRPGPPPKPSFTTRALHTIGHLLDEARSPQDQMTLDLEKRLYTKALQPAPPSYEPLAAAPKIPLHGVLGLGTLADTLSYDAARNQQTAGRAAQAVSQRLRRASRGERSGTGGAAAVTPGFLRLPTASILSALADVAPVASRVTTGAANDVGQYILGAIPATAELAGQAVTKGPGAAAKSLVKGTVDIAKHPLDHPLFAFQLAHGGESALGRTVGAVGRSGVVGKGAQRAFSTERAPLAIGGPAAKRLVQYRHFSKDPAIKGVQALLDKRLAEGPIVQYHGRDVVTRVAPDSKVASMLGRDAAGRLRSHGDFVADRANSVERANRAHMQRELLDAMPTREHGGGLVGQAIGGYFDRRLPQSSRIAALSRPEQGILGMVMTGVIRSAKTFEPDLRKELARVTERAKHPFDHPEEKQANLARGQAIVNVLRNPKAMANAERIVTAGRELAHHGRRLTAEAVKQGALSPEAAARAPLFDYAMAHMDARHFTPEEHRALEADAMAHEHTAADRVQALKKAGAPAKEVAQAQEMLGRLRDYRISVSGRHPDLVRRHETLGANAMQAARRAKVAGAEHARAEKARQRLIGAQSSRRGRRQAEALGEGITRVKGERVAGRATAAEKAKLAKLDARIAETKARRQAAEAAHREARAELAKVPLPEPQPGLRQQNGAFLPNDAIHAHMQAAGIPVDKNGPVIAYLPHRPDAHDRGSYHRAQALLRRDSLEGYRRTGAAFQKGITGSGHELIADHLVRMGITTGRGAIGQFDQLAHDAGVKRHDGEFFTPKEAELEAKNLSNVPGQPKLIPVRNFAARMSPGQQAIVHAAQDPLALDPAAFGDISSHIERAFKDRTDMTKDRQARNVVLMPEDLVGRFQKQLTATAGRSPIGSLVARSFRTAVLPFSVKWLVGNVAEAALRMAIIGANPLDYAAGRKVVTALKGRDAKTVLGKQMLGQIIGLDAERAGTSTEVLSALLGGLFYGEKGLTIHRDARDFADSRLRVPAETLGGLGKTTVVKELGGMLGQIPQTVFAFNRVLERQAQITALGRYVRRDIQEFSKSWIKSATLQREAIKQAARGLFDTPQQRDAAHFMDVTLGQYSRFSPKVRATIQTAMPFLPWYLNSARFVFWTLPIGHPLKTAALNAAEVAFHKDWQDQHKDLPPGELKSAVPLASGGNLDLARFTPMGAFTGAAGGDLSTLTAPVYPQAMGIVHAVQGQDPFGRPMQVPKTPKNPSGKPTTGDIVHSIIDQGLGSFWPGYAPAERVAQHGETAYGNSSLLFGIKTKPGSAHGYTGLTRWLDPFRPVYLKRKSGGKIRTTADWSKIQIPGSASSVDWSKVKIP